MATGRLPTSCKMNAPCIDIRGSLIILNKAPLMLSLLANIVLQGLEGELIESVRQIVKPERTFQCYNRTKSVSCKVKILFLGAKTSKCTHCLWFTIFCIAFGKPQIPPCLTRTKQAVFSFHPALIVNFPADTKRPATLGCLPVTPRPPDGHPTSSWPSRGTAGQQPVFSLSLENSQSKVCHPAHNVGLHRLVGTKHFSYSSIIGCLV